MPTITNTPDHEVDRRRALSWIAVAIGSLLLAGVFATLLVVGRVPPFSGLIADAGFFKRCLVVHVDLALVLWFYAFVAALFVLIPARQGSHLLGRWAVLLSAGGVVLLMASATIREARPVLSNYVPVLDHPLFVAGLVAIAAGVAVTLLDPRLLAGNEISAGAFRFPSAALPFLRASAVAILLALVTFAASWMVVTKGLSPEAHYEAVMWGGGHALQFASTSAMLSVWIVLLAPVLGQAPVSRGLSALLSAVLVTPLFGAPMLALQGTDSLAYRVGNTRLMQFGIAPVVVVFLFLSARAMLAALREGTLGRDHLRDVRVTGFLASASLTLLGFGLGAFISGPNTTVPAHYHASIGGVTVAFMAVTYPLLGALGLPPASARLRRLVPWQPVLLAAGQMIFALGFALAGAHGMQRKSYGSEQKIRSVAEYLGLGVMGVGGALAVVGGALFLVLVGGSFWRHVFNTSSRQEGDECQALTTNTRSSG